MIINLSLFILKKKKATQKFFIKMQNIYEFWQKLKISYHVSPLKLKKTQVLALQREDKHLITQLQDNKYGVKILLVTKRYCVDIAKNLKDDVFIIDMENATFNLMSQFQAKLNIPLNYELNEIFSKHCFIFIFNLPKCIYLKEFLRYLHEESQNLKKFTVIYCTELNSTAQYLLSGGFQLIT